MAIGKDGYVFVYDSGKISGGTMKGITLEIYSGGVVEDLTIWKT